MVTRTFNKWLMKTLCRIAERYIMERGDEENIYLTMSITKLPESDQVYVWFNNSITGKDYIEGLRIINDPRIVTYEVVKQDDPVKQDKGDKHE